MFDHGQARQEVVKVMMYAMAPVWLIMLQKFDKNNNVFEVPSKSETLNKTLKIKHEIKQNFDSDLLASHSKHDTIT